MSGSFPRRETKEFMVNMEMQAGQTYNLTVYDHKKTADYMVQIVPSEMTLKSDKLTFKMYEVVLYEALFAKNTYSVIDIDIVPELVFLSSIGFYSNEAGTETVEFSTRDGRFRQSVTFTVEEAPKPPAPVLKWWETMPAGDRDYPEDNGMGWIYQEDFQMPPEPQWWTKLPGIRRFFEE